MSIAKKIGITMGITVAEEAIRIGRQNPNINPRAILKTIKDELYFYLNGKEAPKKMRKLDPSLIKQVEDVSKEQVIRDRDTGDEHHPKAKVQPRKGTLRNKVLIVDMSQIFKKPN